MSEFWKRKARTFFTIFDLNKDGLLSKADWIEMSTRFANIEKADKQKTEQFIAPWANVWEQFVKHAANKKQLTRDEFVESLEKLRNDPEFIKREEDLIYGFFKLMDLNHDGYLSQEEHQRLFDQHGIPDVSFSEATFKAMDLNGDGKLSKDEFVSAFFDFVFSEDENSPNRFFFGPLVD